MAGDAVAATQGIPKPLLRGLHNGTIRKNLIVAGVLMAIITIGVKVFHNDPKKQRYADFYKTYDANKSFKRMVDAGLLQSVKEL